MNEQYEPEEIRSLASQEIDVVSGGRMMSVGMAVGDQYFLIVATPTEYEVHNIYWGK